MIAITLTFPESMIRKIDQDRGNVNRSKFVVGLIKRVYKEYDGGEQ